MQRDKSFSGIGWKDFLLPASPERPQLTPKEFYLFSNCLFGEKKKRGFLFVLSHTVWRRDTQTWIQLHRPLGACADLNLSEVPPHKNTHTHAHVYILFKDKGKDEQRRASCGCWLCAELAAASQRQRGQDGKQLLRLSAPSRRYNAGRIRAKCIKSQHRNFFTAATACKLLISMLALRSVQFSLTCDGTDVKNCSKFYPE